MSRDAEPYAIAFVGDSDSGKTSLLEVLIPVLAARGLAVASVKHASHGFDADRPGKDSHRLYTSGAQAVVVISDSQVATFERRDAERVTALDAALARLPDGLDLVLVEGFAWEPIPRFVLVAQGCVPRREHRESGPLLGVIQVPKRAPGEKPMYPDELLHALADQIVVRDRLTPAPLGRRGRSQSQENATWKQDSAPVSAWSNCSIPTARPGSTRVKIPLR